MFKSRVKPTLWILSTILIGLLSRTSFVLQWIPTGIGDLLYAVLIYFLVLWINPKLKPVNILCIAFGICMLVETSQLISWQWLLQLRDSHLGKLILGNDFRLSDLVYLTLGTLVGYFLDVKRIRNTATTNELH